MNGADRDGVGDEEGDIDGVLGRNGARPMLVADGNLWATCS